MATRRWILFLLTATLLSALAGCGGGGTFNPQNSVPPPPPGVSIAFQPPPAGSVQIGSTTTVTVAVSNDPSESGVQWNLTCHNTSNCGALSASHTCPTGGCQAGTSSYTTSVTYTPPSSLFGNTEIVNIVGFAVADENKSVFASINVVSFGNNLQAGNYVIQAQGSDSNGVNAGAPNYQFAAVVHLDGNGGITPIAVGQPAGDQTVNFFDPNANGGSGGLVSKSDSISGGSYFLGPDGRGTITINTPDNDIGGNGIETFTFVYLNGSQALITQGDFLNSGGTSCIACTTATASGTVDLQASAIAPLSGGYAFVVSGEAEDANFGGLTPIAFGGVFALDATGLAFCTTPPSSKNCEFDQVQSSGPVTPGQGTPAGTTALVKTLSGTLSYPDPNPFGKVTLNLTANGSSLAFTGYMVDSTHIKLIENDFDPSSSVTPFGSTAGLAIGQGPATGSFDTGSFSGSYVFGVLGTDLTSPTSSPATSASVGVFAADGSGNLTNGFMDTFLQSNPAQETVCYPSGACNSTTPGAQISTTFTGTYSVSARGVGHLITPSSVVLAPPPVPSGTFGRVPSLSFIFFLTGNETTSSSPVLVLEYADMLSTSSFVYPFLGAGIAYPQAASSSLTFSGDYGFGFIQNNGTESDSTATMRVDAAAQTLSGTADVSTTNVTLDQAFSGTAQTSTECLVMITGCFPESLQNSSSSAFLSANQPFPADFYVIDQDHGFFVETDLMLLSPVSNPSGVVSFGYYARSSALTPPAASSVQRPRR